MSDLLSCLQLTRPLELYLHPTATPDSVLHQCLEGNRQPSAEDIGEGLIDAGLILLGAGGAARAARSAGKAARAGGKIFKGIPHQMRRTQPSSQNYSQNGDICADPLLDSVRLLLGLTTPILISPVGVPGYFGSNGQCRQSVNPKRTSEQLADGIADFLMDRFGPGPGQWLAETFDL